MATETILLFSHTNPYILNVTRQFRWSYFELGLPVQVMGKISRVHVFFSFFNNLSMSRRNSAERYIGAFVSFQKTVISCSSYF